MYVCVCVCVSKRRRQRRKEKVRESERMCPTEQEGGRDTVRKEKRDGVCVKGGGGGGRETGGEVNRLREREGDNDRMNVRVKTRRGVEKCTEKNE